ncbi:MAG: acyl--CoA ligase, partial [Actinomycetota bacterium]|nr:acyl--CoA ligase [Actinomycetota bacterium]
MFADLLRLRAADQGSAVALGVQGGPSLTFGEWHRRSEAMAGGLSARAVRPGDRVVLVFDGRRWADLAMAYAAVQRVGGVAVVLSPDWPAPAPADVAADCGAAVVVGPRELVGPGAAGSVRVAAPADLERGNHERGLPDAPRADDLGELVYASGPLRRLRGVPGAHRTIGSALDGTEVGQAGPGAWVHALPVGASGTDALWFAVAASRRRAVTVASFDPDGFCALVAREEASRVGLTPSSAGMLVASAAPGRHDLSSVNEVLLAEGGARPTLLAGLAASFPSASVVDAGTLRSPSGSLTLLTYDRGRPGALGRAEPAGRVRILDDVGRAQPDGEVGHVRPALAGGEAAPPWVAEADEAWWSSSSPVLGYLDQGLLYVVSSRRDVVRLPRATVSAAEVGQVLCRHPAVTDAAVLGLPRNRTAERLAAAVVATSAVTADELREGVRRRLGDARTPQEILFTQRLPRNDSGCLLAGRLRRQLGLPVDRPLPERGDPDVQETIAAIWQRVLGREEV